MKEFFKSWNPKAATLKIIEQANNIIDDYEDQGYTLTLRQLYYQFVARDIIENTEQSYKSLSSKISNARMAGMISWNAIEDRNREHNSFWISEDPEAEIANLPNFIRFDQWARQDYYVEVWVEKEALGAVVAKACDPLLVPYMSCKGYLSASEAWRAGKRFEKAASNGKECVLIHLGDHDPSGIDMTRDNDSRLSLFSYNDYIDVKRIALNMDQIEQYQPPNNPAKLTDPRAKDYIKKFGGKSWELDALEPRVIEALITDHIEPLIDWNVWDEITEEENEVKENLSNLLEVYQNM